jgi:hypothetical protein
MKEAGIPVTRENYIATNWGEPACRRRHDA